MWHPLLPPLCVAAALLCLQQAGGGREGQLVPPLGRGWGAAEQCAICLRAYRLHEALKLLSCSHAYHSKCIDLWHCTQPGRKTCPLCRRRVTAVALIPLHAHSSEQN
uniref:RING-type domain-containing protein n=1 Tax=Phasianus colchicus TaxID=9054 RepID=A0A669Q7Q3_PHACC